MKNTIPKKIPVLFSWPKKILASFIDQKKSLLAKMSDQSTYPIYLCSNMATIPLFAPVTWLLKQSEQTL